MTRLMSHTPKLLLLLTGLLFSIASTTAIAANQSDTSVQLQKISLQLPWKHQFEFAGFYAAIEQGYFAEQGLELELREYQNEGNIIDIVLNGEADYGIDSDNLLLARLQGKPVVMLANYFKKFPLVLLAQPGLNTLAEMKGKRLMISGKDQESMIIRAAFQQAGLIPGENIELVPHTFNIKSLVSGEVDAMTAFRSNEPFFLEQNSIPYELIELTDMLQDVGGVNLFTSEVQAKQHPEQTRAFLDAANRGWHYALNHPAEIIDLILKKYSSRKSREALLFEAEKTHEMIMPETYAIGSLMDDYIRTVVQTLTTVGQQDDVINLQGLFLDNKIFECCEQSPWQKNTDLALTAEERAWLHEHPVIHSSVLNAPPFLFWQDGAKGISVDLLDLVATKLGIKVEYQRGISLPEAFKNVRNHEKLDLLHPVTHTPERETFFVFSQDHLKQPRVLFTRLKENILFSLDDLHGKTIAIEEGYLTQQQLAKEHPQIKQLLVKDAREALSAVSWNRADAYIGNQMVAQYQIAKMGLSNLKVTALSDVEDHKAAFAIRNDWPIFATIINKALNTITLEERGAINRKYTNIEITQGRSYANLLWLLLSIALLLFFILLWNHLLRRRVAESTAELQQHKEQLETLLDANTVELRQLSRAVEQSHSTIVITDLNGNIEFVNPAFSSTTGYTKEEALGQNTKIMKSGKQDADFYQMMWKSLLAGEVWRGEMLNKRKDGTLYWEFATISPVKDAAEKTTHYVAVKENISARKQAEKLSFEHRDQLVTFMETLPDAVFLKDGKGRWLLSNHVGRKLFNVNDFPWQGKTDAELGAEQPELAALHSAFIMSDEEVWQDKEVSIDHQKITGFDGQKNILELRKMPIFGHDNERKAMVIIVRDITEQRQNEAKLIDAQRQAETANRAKSGFLSNMSHELRTPMNAILGFAQLLQFDEDLNDEQQDSLSEITIAGHHLLELINEILDLARIESGHIKLVPEQVKLAELVDECFSLITPVAEKEKISMNHEDMADYFVYADRTRLKQALINLLSNAIKYNRKQGTVDLSVRPVNDTEIRITITDTGNGIGEDRLEQLFKPFDRLGAEGGEIEGTGIGLTITRNLIEMMDGRIGVDSKPGVGSQFWIELPQKLFEQTEKASNTEDDFVKTLSVVETAQRSVLCIEDNPANLKLISQIVSKQKHINLLTAGEPKLGLELAASHHLDLILLDINMPHMDGYQMLNILQSDERLKDIPVIAITANAMPKDIEKGKAAGFVDYLTKPLDVPQFIEVLEQQLNTRQTAPTSI